MWDVLLILSWSVALSRFSGGRALGAQPANEETGVGGLGELDGKVQQCLKHLAKSNSTTKLKALQVCR